jgi:hypothetical protein
VSADDERRAAYEQAVARDANELAEQVASSWKGPTETIDVRCECARPDCRTAIRLTVDEYESVRADPHHFVTLRDHVDPRVDRVIGSIREYTLVEKTGAEAKKVAERTDPRS